MARIAPAQRPHKQGRFYYGDRLPNAPLRPPPANSGKPTPLKLSEALSLRLAENAAKIKPGIFLSIRAEEAWSGQGYNQIPPAHIQEAVKLALLSLDLPPPLPNPQACLVTTRPCKAGTIYYSVFVPCKDQEQQGALTTAIERRGTIPLHIRGFGTTYASLHEGKDPATAQYFVIIDADDMDLWDPELMSLTLQEQDSMAVKWVALLEPNQTNPPSPFSQVQHYCGGNGAPLPPSQVGRSTTPKFLALVQGGHGFFAAHKYGATVSYKKSGTGRLIETAISFHKRIPRLGPYQPPPRAGAPPAQKQDAQDTVVRKPQHPVSPHDQPVDKCFYSERQRRKEAGAATKAAADAAATAAAETTAQALAAAKAALTVAAMAQIDAAIPNTNDPREPDAPPLLDGTQASLSSIPETHMEVEAEASSGIKRRSDHELPLAQQATPPSYRRKAHSLTITKEEQQPPMRDSTAPMQELPEVDMELPQEEHKNIDLHPPLDMDQQEQQEQQQLDLLPALPLTQLEQQQLDPHLDLEQDMHVQAQEPHKLDMPQGIQLTEQEQQKKEEEIRLPSREQHQLPLQLLAQYDQPGLQPQEPPLDLQLQQQPIHTLVDDACN